MAYIVGFIIWVFLVGVSINLCVNAKGFFSLIDLYLPLVAAFKKKKI